MFTMEYDEKTGFWRVYDDDGAWYMTHTYETCLQCVERHNTECDSNGDWRGYPEEPEDYPDEDPEEAAWHDGSDISCKDCPEDECTGHCMSCAYRSF